MIIAGNAPAFFAVSFYTEKKQLVIQNGPYVILYTRRICVCMFFVTVL